MEDALNRPTDEGGGIVDITPAGRFQYGPGQGYECKGHRRAQDIFNTSM